MRRGGRGAVVVALALAVLGLVAPASAGAKEAPKRWDKRVLRFVRYVEKERGLDFEHPVAVRFLPDEEFLRELGSDEELTKEERELEEQLAGELLALGLVGEQIDLSQASEDLDAAGTVGYYDSEIEELVVRGSGATTPDAKVTIVHELTHALQDQHFDIEALYEDAKDSSEVLALDFLLEGDATTVENAYIGTLSTKEQDEYSGDVEAFTDEPLPEGVPYALDVIGYAPYLLGEAYVFALDPDGGTAGRDRAFRAPPTTEEVLVDPVALERREAAKKVPDPKLEPGEVKAYDPGQFGVITLYLMLATRLDVGTALDAVTGWGGDRSVGFDKAGAACVRVNVTGDSDKDTRQLEQALTAWRKQMPAGAVEVSRSRDVVSFTACAAEGVVEPTVEQYDRAFYNVLAGRISTVLDVASVGIPLTTARCVGDRVSTDPDVVAIFDALVTEGRDITDDEQAVVDASFDTASPACGL